MDLLAFPVSPRSGAQFIEGVSGTISNFLHGKVDYVSPINAADRNEQTVRMLRPLLEIPFLEATSHQILIPELKRMRDQLQEGEKLSERALNEFSKMMRNARYEGAHNRFSQPKSGDEVAELVKQISDLIQKQEYNNIPVVPEYIRKENIEKRTLTKEAQEANKYLIPPDKFRADFTDSGTLYHGTPKTEYALAMMRNGLIPSIRKRQGAAAFGTGVYTATKAYTTFEYAGSNGITLEFSVKSTKNLRVLDLEEFLIKNEAEYQKLATEAANDQVDINEYLAKKWQLDIIVNKYPLIMNPDAVVLPKRMKEVISSKLAVFCSKNLDHDYKKFANLISMANAFGIDLRPIVQKMAENLNNDYSGYRCFAIDTLVKLRVQDPDIHQQIIKCLEDKDGSVRSSAIDALAKLRAQDPDIHQQIIKCLEDKDSSVRSSAIDALAKLRDQNPYIHQQIR